MAAPKAQYREKLVATASRRECVYKRAGELSVTFHERGGTTEQSPFRRGIGALTGLTHKRNKIKGFHVREAHNIAEKQQVQLRCYVRACKDIAEANGLFCEKGGARKWGNHLFL